MDISSFSYETQNVHGHIWHIFMKNIHLIGGFNPLKNMSSSDWIIIPNLVGEKKVMFQTTNPVIPLLIPLLINPIINHLPSSPNNHEITIKSPSNHLTFTIFQLPKSPLADGCMASLSRQQQRGTHGALRAVVQVHARQRQGALTKREKGDGPKTAHRWGVGTWWDFNGF